MINEFNLPAENETAWTVHLDRENKKIRYVCETDEKVSDLEVDLSALWVTEDLQNLNYQYHSLAADICYRDRHLGAPKYYLFVGKIGGDSGVYLANVEKKMQKISNNTATLLLYDGFVESIVDERD